MIGLLVALLSAMWGVVAYWSWSQHQNVLTSSTTLLEQITSAAEEQTLRMFKHAETSLTVANHWMADHPDEDAGQSASFIALVDELRLMSGGLLDIRMVSKTGGLFYIPKRGLKPLADVSDRDYYRAQQVARTRGFFIGDPVLSRVTGRWGVPVSIPVEQAGGEIGVLFAAMELDLMSRAFEAERIKPDGAISIIRDDGTFLFRTPTGTDIIGRSIAGTPSWDEHMAMSLRGVYFSDGSAVGTPAKLVSFARLRDYPLYVTVTAEVDQLLAPWRHETMALMTVALVVTLVSLALGISLLAAMAAEESAQRETSRTQRDAQAILAAAGEGICGIDAKGHVTFVNPAGSRMLGWEGTSLIGQPLHASVHHSHPDGSPYPERDCPITLTLVDGKTHDVTTETFWRKNGTSFPVEIVASAVMEDDVITGAVLVFRDVSQRLESERALVAQSTELARSNSDLEQFAYVASHDLREPLRQVASFVTLLERRFGASLDKEGRDYIAYARDGAKRMDRLIIDLLEFSRIGHRGLTLRLISITEAVDDAMATLSGVIAETQALVTRDESMPEVVAVQDELVRLFQNLIGNALKYRHPDRKPEIAITARHSGAEWIIDVRDNGIGIESQYGEKIFGIFQRLHTRDKFEGTGIGLAICKKIVEHLGGRIWVESSVGEGCTFSIALPDA